MSLFFSDAWLLLGLSHPAGSRRFSRLRAYYLNGLNRDAPNEFPTMGEPCPSIGDKGALGAVGKRGAMGVRGAPGNL